MSMSPAFNPSLPSQSPVTPSASPLSRGLLTPPSPVRQQHNILVTMGSCTWQGKNGFRCQCSSGSCVSGFDVTGTSCDNCMHPMSMHLDYPTLPFTTSTHPRTRIFSPYDMPPYINSRAKLVDELIARVQHYHIIRVNGTPASGKTTVMNLMANKLLEKYGQTIPIHVLSGWDRETVHSATGWAVHLEQETGVHGRSWLTYPAYLLLDEAQQSYWDDELWADLFKRIEPGTSPFIVLFMSYGSPHRGFVGFDGEEHIKTPMVFGAEQQISLRPEESIQDYGLSPLLPWKPVGLLLDENEAMDVVTRYAFTIIRPSLSLTPDLKKGFFLSSNGHVGLLTSLTRVLQDVPELYDLVRRGVSIDWLTTSKILFSQPLRFFRYVSGYPFTRGLPPSKILRHSASASVFKTAIACNGIYKSSFETKSEELKQALMNIWRNGWLHAEKSNDDIHFVFASQIHRWYCHSLFTEILSDNEINYVTPLQLAVDAIAHFHPHQLSDAPRSSADDSSPLEDQYQKEFYRCLFPMLDGHVVMSPEYVIKTDTTKGGTIDFLVARKKWGLELLRDRDRLVEHMKRFEPGGQYFSMIQSGNMEQYIVLDFTNILPKKPRPEYRGHLYHVVFSQNYRQVEMIDASDLSLVSSFALMENANPIA